MKAGGRVGIGRYILTDGVSAASWVDAKGNYGITGANAANRKEWRTSRGAEAARHRIFRCPEAGSIYKVVKAV